MISIELYVTLGIAAVLLAVYGLMDMRNRFYANIGSLFMSSIIVTYLSVAIGNGTVQAGVVVNQTSGSTTPIILQDASMGWLILLPAVGAMIAVAYLIYDAYTEKQQEREAEDW
jgi:hypothetical protein